MDHKSVTVVNQTYFSGATILEVSEDPGYQRCKAFFTAFGSYGIFVLRHKFKSAKTKRVFILEMAGQLSLDFCLQVHYTAVHMITESFCEFCRV